MNKEQLLAFIKESRGIVDEGRHTEKRRRKNVELR
jgi:hypothetical protein